ncbi:HEAT repeat domain-containing protein [Methanosarcina barkeri]|uniref:HEAT repeat-containing protein n=1 Tax=Methanosarcina barkeri CM1 TaxID=796385 RepID=A0A0G3CFM6_METBA|nr:HEAT repeat domain-containing protein [Methanosarcina barkeri]AKJ37892.1 HEAT repeat-containing protein [Methanosarcina barkeri CM1]
MVDQEKIHNQCLSDDLKERIHALEQLEEFFSLMPDKQQSWSDLLRLTKDEDSHVSHWAASALGSAFSQVPDKKQAWNDLIKLTNDENNYVRYRAADALGSAFSQVPDKKQAWNDLIKLAKDEDSDVRHRAAYALGSAFSQVPDKKQAWNDLHRLTNDEVSHVRSSSNHSLGRVSIFMASQAETDEDYKKELEKAIEFFETAAKEASYFNPAQFCLPFYRSFHTIIFKKQEAREEVNKYLEEAKDAIKGSESKKLLFEAVQNLAEALKEVQNLETLDLQAMKGELNFYRKYCDHAAELMKCTDEKAPFATKVLRKGLPILDRNLKELLEEIQKKAKTACQVSQGTATQEIACAVSREVQKWEISDPEEMVQNIENLAYILKNKVADVPENEYILSKIELMRNERDLNKQYGILLFVIAQIPTMKVITEKELDRKFFKLDLIYDKTISIETKLDLIQKTLDTGLEKLDMLSNEVGGREGELIQIFSKNIYELTQKCDKKTLESFLREVLEKENILIEEIDKSSASQEEKEESKSSILNIRSVVDKVKHPIKSFGKDVTKEIVVTYAAEEIVKLVFQLMSMATLGVPIPPQILNLLSSITKRT